MAKIAQVWQNMIMPVIDSQPQNIEKRLSAIEARNQRVEVDKAWEGSLTRKVLIVAFTYIAIGLYLKFVLGIDPIRNAIVPSAGFVLSTLTLPFFKNVWKKYIYKK
jgi:hypothetical protein